MTFQDKVNDLDVRSRINQIKEDDKKEAEFAKREKKNDNFYMIYKDKESSQKIRELISKAPKSAELFLFLAEQSDRTNAVVASGKALATHLSFSESSISRAIKYLTDNKYIEVLKSGGTNVFVLNPSIVWQAWRTGKKSCLFGNAKVLVSMDEQDVSLKKRLSVLIDKSKNDDEIEGKII